MPDTLQKFRQLIMEDKDRAGSYRKLEALTGTGTSTIQSWLTVIKVAPCYDVMTKYGSLVKSTV